MKLAARASFEPSSKHKLSPRRFGLEPYTGEAEDPTYCDGDAGFKPEDVARVPRWLYNGIVAGLVGAHDIANDPSIVWGVSEDGWVFEGRITVPGQALYHGYPVLANEPIAIAVLDRFGAWVRRTGQLQQFDPILMACRERYPR